MTDRPHIFLVITDQQRFDTIRQSGASWMHTPHLDRLPRDLHPDVYVSRMAQWWLRTWPRPDRLFMQIGLPGPHPPYDPPPGYADRYLNADDMPMPQIDDAELDGLPDYLKEKRRHDVEVDHDGVAWKLNPTDDELRRLRAHYHGNVTLIDEEVGALMQTLEDTGYLENSVVIFCSDHGDALGDHGLSQKWSMYEPVTRVPLIVWAPGRFDPRREAQMCQLFDLGPTILDLAGARQPDPCHAKSLLPALEGKPWTGRDIVVCEQAGDVSMTGARLATMIRDERWKAVFVHGAGDGQLFDLQDDPDERVNLFADPSAAEDLNRLRARLAEGRTATMLEGKDYLADGR